MSAPIENDLALAPAPKTLEPAHTCRVCGQQFDLRDLAQAFHHSDEPHAPLRG